MLLLWMIFCCYSSSYPSQLNVGASRIEDIISPEAPRNVTDKPFAHKYTVCPVCSLAFVCSTESIAYFCVVVCVVTRVVSVDNSLF